MTYRRRMRIHQRIWHRTKRTFSIPSKPEAFPDDHVNWHRWLEPVIAALHEEKPFSALLSSSSPVSTHVIANRTAHELSIPWVADLRDLWTQNHHYPYDHQRWEKDRELELRVLARASRLITVTPQWRDKLASLHGKPVDCVPNGFYDVSRPFNGKSRSNKTTVVYTGQVYPPFQNLSLVIEAIEEVRNAGGEVELSLYGNVCFEAERVCRERFRSVPGWVHLHGIVPRAESYRAQQRADILLLLNWEDPGEKGVAPTKLYEYLPFGIPILATGGHGNDFVSTVLSRTGAGTYCTTKDTIVGALQSAVNNVPFVHERNETVIQSLSYPSLALRLGGILDQVAGAGDPDLPQSERETGSLVSICEN